MSHSQTEIQTKIASEPDFKSIVWPFGLAAAPSPDQHRDIHPGELMHFLLPSAMSGERTLLSALLILTFPVTGALGIDALARQAIQHEDMHFHFFPASQLLRSPLLQLFFEMWDISSVSSCSGAGPALYAACGPEARESPGLEGW